jgi:hypothetical protein
MKPTGEGINNYKIYPMSKLKKSNQKIGKYLREISVVVIGVAITLSVSYWITNRSEKRDMALYLTAVKWEMEDNMELIELRLEQLQKSIEYATYLMSHNKNLLNADTIRSYNCDGGYYSFSMFNYKADAFEMFKISGAMRFINDKRILLGIWDVYNKLSELKNDVELIHQMKLDEAKNDKLLSKEKDFIPMYYFYTNININYPYNIVHVYQLNLEVLNKMIERLN